MVRNRVQFSDQYNFYLYINGLPVNAKETKLVSFAYDKNIFVRAENGQILQQKIHRVMNELHSWFYANKSHTEH
jgi:argininosuccinate synthase